MPDSQPTLILGWRERVDIPAWHIRGIRAKIDTGARTSAIDVAQIEELEDGRIRFEVVARTSPTRRTRWIEATPVRQTIVKSSNGESQTRHVCLVHVRIGPFERDIEVSLVCRQGMLCRMLIGRTAMEGMALVDPSQTFLVTSGTSAKQRQAPAEGTT
ncbi:MAG: ATP-dependent zinc protease [Phycisphaeraceae bacterium]|nr:ATP-dependent zinc protease [Phycisphaerales bacterium]MCB9859491.1 ATP-dependent zinc protease [Phycisphaeraceae bacterium]